MAKKRGQPPKPDRDRKGKTIQIRAVANEKEAFDAAAELAGLSLSAWMRERLRTAARKELESAGRAVAFLGNDSGPKTR